ncbi:MAG: helix-turn-helix domain-containing protein [Opitutaceae bacterium]|nr:helix-turn-helix domain-containing protein [Opitutaceae bacterium]
MREFTARHDRPEGGYQFPWTRSRQALKYKLVYICSGNLTKCHMLTVNKIKQLADYQGRIAELQKQIEKERAKELARLPEKFGYQSAKELIKAIRAASGAGGKRRGQKALRRRKRARITAEMKDKIKSAIQAGKSGTQIARDFGISLPSVYNIKKAFGLVKARKKK